MLKVVVADDEVRICRLICALVDWQALGFVIVGTASNGLEAIDMVEQHKPDLLITDIRMPGCNGLELIERAKSVQPSLEMVIISGYGNFSYAQTALRYGVGDYLLKPINKVELTHTLEKLREKIQARAQSLHELDRLLADDQTAKTKRLQTLTDSLCNDKNFECSLEVLQQNYNENFQNGIFQAFSVKIDYNSQDISESALQVVLEKVESIFKGNLKSACYVVVANTQQDSVLFIINFERTKQDDVARFLRNSLNQLVSQKSMLGPILLTVSCGNRVLKPQELRISLQECQKEQYERIVLGTDRVLTPSMQNKVQLDKKLIEQYARSVAQACEVFSIKDAENAVIMLKNAVLNTKNVCGEDIYKLVKSAGTVFIMERNLSDESQMLATFQQNCDRCGTLDTLFTVLCTLQNDIISNLKNEQDLQSMRPIRQAKQYIASHFNQPITLEQVSDIVGLTPTYFSALFKKEVGEGFAKYLVNVRMEQAKILLRERNDSIAVVCQQVGYHDTKHFNQLFEKNTGLKPSAYRKLYG